jgi:tetratricopeptide (TPR) repeat protein
MAWQNLGLAQWDRGELDAALQSFVRATQDPELPVKVKADFYNVMGIIALEKGDAALAEQHLRASAGTDPRAVEALYQLGLLQVGHAERLRAEGRIAEADRRLEQGVGNLAQAATRFPRYHLARLTLAQVLESYGQSLEQRGEREHALRRYQSALDQLAALSRQLATEQDPQAARARAVTEAGVDPVELRQRLEAHVARPGTR